MTAGPTPLPPRVLSVMAEPVVYHRAPDFDALLARVLDRLPVVFGTANDVMVFAASGSGAMESAVANLVAPGDPVLACAAGKFGERWITPHSGRAAPTTSTGSGPSGSCARTLRPRRSRRRSRSSPDSTSRSR